MEAKSHQRGPRVTGVPFKIYFELFKSKPAVGEGEQRGETFC